VGLVDTRVWRHPWLSGALVAYPEDQIWDSSRAGGPALPNHATFVAGLVLRQAPGAVLELRTALEDDATSTTWKVATTLARLADSSVDVVNLSLGCLTEDAKPPLVLSAALDALGPRMVVVAAAGNHAEGPADTVVEPSYPAALDNVVAVGAWHEDRPADFTPTAPWVDAMAPGVDVVSTCDPDGDGSAQFGTWSGTSFAAAVVTGAIAARTKRSGDARQAWRKVRKAARQRDDQGRPIVDLRTLDDWPPDGQGTPSPRP
jgi:subtilisin family serine protease